MADGSVNSTSYITNASVGNGRLTLSAGTGVSLSSTPRFDANQSTNKTITVSTNGTSSNTANTLVLRNSSGGISIGALSAASANLSGNITASGFLVSGQSGFLKADGTVDTTTYLSNGNIKDPQITLTAFWEWIFSWNNAIIYTKSSRCCNYCIFNKLNY